MLTWARLVLKILGLINSLLSFLKLRKARQEGREEAVSKINKDTEKLKNEFKEIDTTDRSFDDALGRLHTLASDENARPGTTKTND